MQWMCITYIQCLLQVCFLVKPAPLSLNVLVVFSGHAVCSHYTLVSSVEVYFCLPVCFSWHCQTKSVQFSHPDLGSDMLQVNFCAPWKIHCWPLTLESSRSPLTSTAWPCQVTWTLTTCLLGNLPSCVPCPIRARAAVLGSLSAKLMTWVILLLLNLRELVVLLLCFWGYGDYWSKSEYKHFFGIIVMWCTWSVLICNFCRFVFCM